MTLDTSVSKAVFQGNGAATEFPFSFKVWNAEELVVQVTGTDGIARDITAQCSVTLSDEGGVVVYAPGGAPLPAGNTLVILRDMSFLQDVRLITGTRFDPAVIEEALDRATAERQQLLEKVNRAIVVPVDSADPPEELADQIFEARDRAEAAAGNAAASAVKSENMAAQTAEIKANALRELHEEGDAQAARLDNLASRHVLTFEREVERAHAEADRAKAEADRAGQAVILGTQAENLDAVWTLDKDVPAGGTLDLPLIYFAGRNMLHLSYDGVELYPGPQYEEIGAKDARSSSVKMLIPLSRGMIMHAWAIASNVARNVEDAEERAEDAAGRAEAEADRAETARNVARNAAREATEQADRADDAAVDARRHEEVAGKYRNEARAAARCAEASIQGRSIAAVQSADLLDRVPSGFFVVNADLVLPGTIQHPLTPVDSVDDIPPMDGFFLVVPPFTDCPPKPEPNPEPDPDPDPDNPVPPDTPGGNTNWTLPCGKRARA